MRVRTILCIIMSTDTDKNKDTAEDRDSLFAGAAGEARPAVEYSEDDIKTLDWREHIRLRPGMYIGKLGQKYLVGAEFSKREVSNTH